jgi:hypothetical protein
MNTVNHVSAGRSRTDAKKKVDPMFLTHLRRNLVAYLALVIALGTGTAYAAAAIPNGSVTTAKLHTNAVTSTKIQNKTIRNRDMKKPTWVQSNTLGAVTPPAATPDVVSVAPYGFSLPNKARTSVTVFIPALKANCPGNATPSVGLYIDTVPVPGTRTNVPGEDNTRPIQLTTTFVMAGGAHNAQVGITCPGGAVPAPSSPGAETWTIIQTG